jgi:hypothetical protein
MSAGPVEQRGGALEGAWKHCSTLNFFRSFLFQDKKEQKK